jgi:hypothetical protein
MMNDIEHDKRQSKMNALINAEPAMRFEMLRDIRETTSLVEASETGIENVLQSLRFFFGNAVEQRWAKVDVGDDKRVEQHVIEGFIEVFSEPVDDSKSHEGFGTDFGYMISKSKRRIEPDT